MQTDEALLNSPSFGLSNQRYALTHIACIGLRAHATKLLLVHSTETRFRAAAARREERASANAAAPQSTHARVFAHFAARSAARHDS